MIAGLAGVSATTVSLALQQHPRIPLATRQRIVQIAKKIGYSPNAELAQVMQVIRKRQPDRPVIALVTNQAAPSPWRTQIYLKRFYDAVTERAEELGYRIEEFWLNESGMTAKRMSQIFCARNTAGLIIPPSFGCPGKRLPFSVNGLAVAVHGRVFWKPELHRVQADHLYNTMLALKNLRKLGYRRIGIATFHDVEKVHGHEIESAYMYYASRKLLPSTIPPFHADNSPTEDFWEWFGEYQPDAILSSHPGLIENFQTRQIRVPEDVGLAILGVIPELGDVAGIDINARAADRALVDIVVAQINTGERGVPAIPHAITFEGFWQSGATLRAMPKIGMPARKASRGRRG